MSHGIGIVCSNRGRLVTGSVSSSLQLWQVDCTTSPPVVTMVNSMQLDGAIFSAVFDTKMELVSFGFSTEVTVLHTMCAGCSWDYFGQHLVHQLD